MQNNVPAIKIGNHLIEAYKGRYENNLLLMPDKSFKRQEELTEQEYTEWVHWLIATDTPKDRLDTYLEWNGIIGYSSTAYDIAIGKL